MWDPPRPGLEPVSPALAGRFSTTAPPGKPLYTCFDQSLDAGHTRKSVTLASSSLQMRWSPRRVDSLGLLAGSFPRSWVCGSYFLNEGPDMRLHCPLHHHCFKTVDIKWKYYLFHILGSIFTEHLFWLDSRLDAQRKDTLD